MKNVTREKFEEIVATQLAKERALLEQVKAAFAAAADKAVSEDGGDLIGASKIKAAYNSKIDRLFADCETALRIEIAKLFSVSED